ncbi:AraC family transcriptional regulator [Phyllobacterium myrsinacearum]|uniref:AraC-like DNA-binding protein n=1 Tax=Phyllobacterium myrsinacearum TaxID=28101 RepID=A0A839EH03_9HYPH|nr:AraC family transcriptional regulator [Phyllobacterium myrsinacearum]MBA8877658.1 AraC-like DNA-binding protein [Phyllobacterium myrsinacearum]
MENRQFMMFRCGVAGVEAVEAKTKHSFPRHTHTQYGIGVIDQGAQKSLSGRGMVEAGSGDVITVSPGEVHDGAPIGGAERSWRMLYFDPIVVGAMTTDLRDSGETPDEFPQPVIRDARLAYQFDRLFTAMTRENGIASDLRGEELLLTVLAGVFGEPGSSLPFPAIPRAIRRARDLIDDQPAHAVTLDDLARESGLSRFQVVRAFSRATGMTPHAYLVQRRIDLARRMIASGLPLAEAAAASGFADQSHMTRTFVRKYGISPGAYAGVVN